MATGTQDWPQTMRAWQYMNASPGLEKALKLNETAVPPAVSSLTPDAILVRVHYMAVNPADYKLPEMGLVARAMVSPPASPGTDFSGRVVAVGRAAANKYRYQPGEPVFGRLEPTKFGTLAEYILLKNGECLARVPQATTGGYGYSHEKDDDDARLRDYAAVGTAGLVAIQTIKPHVRAGDRVFINGGSGGTGTFGIQIAKALGCHVTASCSGRNMALCRALGADEVFDYAAHNLGEVLTTSRAAHGQAFRLVVDNVGVSPAGQEDLYTAANRFLTEDGVFVQVGGGTSLATVKATMKRALVPGALGGGKRKFKLAVAAQSHDDLATIGGWMHEDKVKVVVGEVFDFARAPEAYAQLKTGRAKGKIVVSIQG